MIIDLRMHTCPSTFLFTKLAIEKLRADLKNTEGDNNNICEFLYSNLQSLKNVERTLEEEKICQVIDSLESKDGYFILKVEI